MTPKAKRSQLLDAPERRGVAFSDFEIRADGDILGFRGYASVFESPYDVFGGPENGGWAETVDRGAFDVTLREKPDVMFLVNHEGMPLARTKSGTLRLTTDRKGLRTEADLDRRDSDVARLEVKMDRGDMDEMSFAFRAKRQEWDDEYTERRILEASIHKGDVSIVNFGANPAAAGASLRSFIDFLDSAERDTVLAEIRAFDNPLDQLRELRGRVDALIRDTTPEERRTLTVTQAEQLLAL